MRSRVSLPLYSDYPKAGVSLDAGTGGIRWLENQRQSSAPFGEPGRCVHIGDRESDIYELFCTAQELGTHFVVRACVDRV